MFRNVAWPWEARMLTHGQRTTRNVTFRRSQPTFDAVLLSQPLDLYSVELSNYAAKLYNTQ